MNIAQFIDIGVPVIGAAIAAFLVLRWGVLGFLGGVVAIWASGLIRIELLNAVDHSRDAGVLDAMWFALLGWVVGLVWCSPFLVGRYIYRYARGRKLNQRLAGR